MRPRLLAGCSAIVFVIVLIACKQTPAPERALPSEPPAVVQLDAKQIEDGAQAKATVTTDGVVRIAWARTDVAVKVDGMPLRPVAGLGSWAAFKASEHGAMVMGDTVVFEDEVDAAMDAAFAGGLEVTALHNHFFFDEPKVYFMHLGGQGEPGQLAAAVKGVWDAIKKVRADNPDVTPFVQRGGKAILYHGWADTSVTPITTIKLYEAMEDTVSRKRGEEDFTDHVRLFLGPGMGHCGGGVGPNNYALAALEAIDAWVEEGRAPDSIVVSHDQRNMTRPWCPYPQVARLKEPGLDSNEAENFVCVNP